MGVNITNGQGCGVSNSDVAGNGNVGVAMFGGDRQTLTPSKHFVTNSTLHHNQRWMLNCKQQRSQTFDAAYCRHV